MPPPPQPLARTRAATTYTQTPGKILAQDSGRDLTLRPRSRDMTRPGTREGAPGIVLADGGGEGQASTRGTHPFHQQLFSYHTPFFHFHTPFFPQKQRFFSSKNAEIYKMNYSRFFTQLSHKQKAENLLTCIQLLLLLPVTIPVQ